MNDHDEDSTDRPSGSLPGDLQQWKQFLFLVLCVAVVFGQAVRFEFVTYDDYQLVYENESFLSNVSNIYTSFTTHVFTTHRAGGAYYRPLVLSGFILEYQLWHLNPLGYHLDN